MGCFNAADAKVNGNVRIYSNFYHHHYERILSHYESMLSKGIKHFIYYEPGALFIGWLEPRAFGLGFRAKWLTNPSEEFIRGFFLQMYHQIGLKKAVLIDDFFITHDEKNKRESPLDRVLRKPSYLKIEQSEGTMDNTVYPILHFSDTLEGRLGN